MITIFTILRQYFKWLSPRRLLHACLNAARIAADIEKLKIQRCFDAVTYGRSSKFYGQAEVYNLAGDIEKIRIGTNAHVRGELLIFPYGGRIIIGDYAYVGKNSVIWSAAEVKIGNHVLISHNCNIIDTDSHEINHLARAKAFEEMLKYGHPQKAPDVRNAPIHIDDYVWLSYNVSVLKGVKIGQGAIVAAGSVVTKDVPPFVMVAGNPARTIRRLPRSQSESMNKKSKTGTRYL